MKQALKQYGSVALLLIYITALSVGLTAVTGRLGESGDNRPTVLATTYPVYLAAQNVLGEDDSVALYRLDGSASGCLHDYQLSPSDRRLTQEADLILMNGAGAESFLDGIIDEDKAVDTAAGVALLCADHDHEHGEEHHEEEYNEHLWLSPSRYAAQVAAVRDALCALNPDAADTYRKNAEAYLEQIGAVQHQLDALSATLSGRPCVLFHDSMAYLAADLGLDVKLTLSVEGESGLSATHLKQVEAMADKYPDLLLLYDTQYALRYEGVAGQPVTVDTAVVGEGNADDWLTAMKKNVETLKKIAG